LQAGLEREFDFILALILDEIALITVITIEPNTSQKIKFIPSDILEKSF
jgi:hypothetical protein